MTCPYCNTEMVPGMIDGDRYPLKWAPKTKYNNVFSNMFKKKIKLTGFYIGDHLECHYCEHCKKMIFDVPEQE